VANGDLSNPLIDAIIALVRDIDAHESPRVDEKDPDSDGELDN